MPAFVKQNIPYTTAILNAEVYLRIMMGWDADFAERADNANLCVGIIGLGYVGLPTAIGFHDAAFTVWGVDVSQRTVDMVLQGKNPTGDPDVDDIVPQPGAERWHITTSAADFLVFL